MALYPGNPEVIFEEQRGMTSVLTKLSFGTHTGTHVDAPKHVFEQGMPVEEMPLMSFIGTCRVLDMTQCESMLSTEDLKQKNITSGERIFLKTKNSFSDQNIFSETYVYLDGDAADYLAGVPVALLGIDALSIKQRGSNDTRPHTAFLGKNIPIIEGVMLRDVPEGRYFFIGLPLRLRGVDGSPLRAILLEENPIQVTK